MSSIAAELRRLMLVRQHYLAAVCRRSGVSRTEFDALDELSHQGPLTPGELGVALSLTSGSVTAMVDRLERLGWARRERHPDDRRKVVVELTPEAERVGEEQIGPLVVAMEAAAAEFSAKEQRVIERFLGCAADGLAELTAGEA